MIENAVNLDAFKWNDNDELEQTEARLELGQ